MREDFERLPETVDINTVGIPDLTASVVERTDTKAIYFRWDGYYEVFKVKIDEPQEIFGRQYPRKEHYPTNEDFGKIAWCFRDESLARKLYRRWK